MSLQQLVAHAGGNVQMTLWRSWQVGGDGESLYRQDTYWTVPASVELPEDFERNVMTQISDRLRELGADVEDASWLPGPSEPDKSAGVRGLRVVYVYSSARGVISLRVMRFRGQKQCAYVCASHVQFS